MSNTWSVYCHQNKINGKKYFGITSRKPQSRWGARGQCYHFYFGRAIAKYGWDNFEHIILYSKLDKETAIMFEQFLIDAFKTKDKKFGYNLTDGGEGTLNPSEETRKRLSDCRKGHIVTEETKHKISESNKGRVNSPEARAKISARNKGKVMSAEARAKISKNCGSRRPEVRAKISASCMGKPSPNKGRKFTEEEKARLYATRRGHHRPLSEEAKAKLSAWHTGRKLSEETRAKISMNRKGIPAWNKGLKLKQVEPE